MTSFKQFLVLCEDARGDLETVKLKMAAIDKRIADFNRPLLNQKQTLEKQAFVLQKRVQQDELAAGKQAEQERKQQQQPQGQPTSTLSTPGSASGAGQPGG